nr:transposase domain-containing protein [Paraburkholderia domus]
MLTCRACGVETYAYLLHVLTERLEGAPDADLRDLLTFAARRAPYHFDDVARSSSTKRRSASVSASRG